jgi:sugar O-acyltransferase (sialic acid O-acetyltransferase NeuD family)
MKDKLTIKKPIIVLGSGGHAKVLIEVLRQSEHEIIGITNLDILKQPDFFGVKILGSDDQVLNYLPSEIGLVNAIGSMPNNNFRRTLAEKMEKEGYSFIQVIHSSAVIAADVDIGWGAQIMANVVMQPGVKIGRHCIINTGVNIDHDTVIEEHCHLAPGVTLSGNVTVGRGTHVGTGTSIIQGVTVGQNCIIAAGSVIFKDVPANTKLIQYRITKLEDIF